MKINWSFIEPVRDQATRLRGDFTAKSEIVKLAEQQAEIARLREENAGLWEALKPLTLKEPVQLTCEGGGFIQAIIVTESELVAARAAIRKGETK